MADQGHISGRIRIPKIKTPEKLPSLLFAPRVTVPIQHEPKNQIERRIPTMALVALDNGVRVDEASDITKQNVYIAACSWTAYNSEGDKPRVVRFSLALRRAFFRFLKTEPNTRCFSSGRPAPDDLCRPSSLA
jgi:hypothetical protein